MRIRTELLLFGSILVGVALSECGSSKPPGVTIVQPFDGEKYMGKWYEIARLDHRFERGLTNVTAEYSLNEDGTINVTNRGTDAEKNKQQEVTGKARFVDGADKGQLKVSFFGPFYSGYNVIALDEDYRYSLVTGNDRDYLWLLAREPRIPEEVRSDYLEKANALGYDIGKLIWVQHDRAAQQ